MILLALLLSAQDPPIDCEKDGTQLALNICADRDFQAADAAMTAQWKLTLAHMRERDRHPGDEPPGTGPGYAQALLNAQRAWIAYREAQCTSESYYTRGGSMRPMLWSNCAAGMSEERTRQLAELIARDHE